VREEGGQRKTKKGRKREDTGEGPGKKGTGETGSSTQGEKSVLLRKGKYDSLPRASQLLVTI